MQLDFAELHSVVNSYFKRHFRTFYSRAAASLTEFFVVVVLLVGETFFQFLVLFIFLLGRQFSNLVNYQPRSGRSADDAFVH